MSMLDERMSPEALGSASPSLCKAKRGTVNGVLRKTAVVPVEPGIRPCPSTEVWEGLS